MEEGPKLYTHKPKKAQLKHARQHQQSMASPMPSGYGAGPPPPPPPPLQPPKESFIRRYKFILPLLLAVNFSVGAYLFMRTKKKDGSEEAGEVLKAPTTPATVSAGVRSTTATATDTEKALAPPATATDTTKLVTTPVLPPKLRAPMPEAQQRELFKAVLEEKRKLKPKDLEEKKRIDEEKALLKQFIRAKSIPSL